MVHVQPSRVAYSNPRGWPKSGYASPSHPLASDYRQPFLMLAFELRVRVDQNCALDPLPVFDGFEGWGSQRIPPVGTFRAELTRRMGRTVSDDTGLAGRYDFVLNFSDGLRGPSAFAQTQEQAPDPAADLFAALTTQLGLKLDARKGLVEIVVVDHVEKVPVDN